MAAARLEAVQGLVRELLREEAQSRIAALTEELFQAAGSVSVESGNPAGGPPAGPLGETGGPGAPQRPAALAQVEESAISLWNWTVTKHTGSVLNDEQRAKLRFVACRLVCLCEGSDPPEGSIRRQILQNQPDMAMGVEVPQLLNIITGFSTRTDPKCRSCGLGETHPLVPCMHPGWQEGFTSS